MPPPPQPPAKTTHISSPKPERRHISPAKEEQRKSFIKECPPQAFKFYMEQHIGKFSSEFQPEIFESTRLALCEPSQNLGPRVDCP